MCRCCWRGGEPSTNGVWRRFAMTGEACGWVDLENVFVVECKRRERHGTPDRAEERGRRFFVE